MSNEIQLQDPIKWLVTAKKDLDEADIHLTNKELVKLLQTYIQETFETYRTKINNASEEKGHTQIIGLSTESLDDED